MNNFTIIRRVIPTTLRLIPQLQIRKRSLISSVEITYGERQVNFLTARRLSCSAGDLSKSDNNGPEGKYIVNYGDVKKAVDRLDTLIIDVRNPDEIESTGKIPSSINIPVDVVHKVFAEMSAQEFKKAYGREKPSHSQGLIFYCRSGKRALKALDAALVLGYSKSKIYPGSWIDWEKQSK